MEEGEGHRKGRHGRSMVCCFMRPLNQFALMALQHMNKNIDLFWRAWLGLLARAIIVHTYAWLASVTMLKVMP